MSRLIVLGHQLTKVDRRFRDIFFWLTPIWPLWTIFNDIWIKIQNFSFKKMHAKILVLYVSKTFKYLRWEDVYPDILMSLMHLSLGTKEWFNDRFRRCQRDQFQKLVSYGRTKRDPVFLVAGCLWVMKIPGLSSKNAATSLFRISIQTRLTRFLSKILTHIFKGWSMGRVR